MNAEAEAAKRQKDNKFSRYWKVGLASAVGATIIGVTGGLAAPLVAGALGGILGGIGLGGVASFLGIFWMNGVLVGALFGAFGAKMTVRMPYAIFKPPY
jgi:predicted lipid-binding transport protein (Tim44 family)